MTRLAIDGGSPVRTKPFPACNTIGEAEKRAVIEVLDSGVLSQFIGAWGPDFLGGPRVRRLETEWAEYFGVGHAISMNSATSGLYAAVGAARIGPGDEVIVSPYTMIASAAAALVYGAVPVFADIDPDTFCLDPASVRACLTGRTRAIIAVYRTGIALGAAGFRLPAPRSPRQSPIGSTRRRWSDLGSGRAPRGKDWLEDREDLTKDQRHRAKGACAAPPSECHVLSSRLPRRR